MKPETNNIHAVINIVPLVCCDNCIEAVMVMATPDNTRCLIMSDRDTNGEIIPLHRSYLAWLAEEGFCLW